MSEAESAAGNGLECLSLLCALHGLSVDREQLAHDLAL